MPRWVVSWDPTSEKSRQDHTSEKKWNYFGNKFRISWKIWRKNLLCRRHNLSPEGVLENIFVKIEIFYLSKWWNIFAALVSQGGSLSRLPPCSYLSSSRLIIWKHICQNCNTVFVRKVKYICSPRISGRFLCASHPALLYLLLTFSSLSKPASHTNCPFLCLPQTQ